MNIIAKIFRIVFSKLFSVHKFLDKNNFILFNLYILQEKVCYEIMHGFLHKKTLVN